eukprot:TRINITY_DN25169_c0_g1_i1.p1 TRINITY_DN25169_c0_g1~~TRINITY_DN25169_c0_g1_i1.p1  ORF type:complete len:521 (+),score=127.43 TRINITY_DN25169_c0_g1_i1:79-1641(+)
MGEVCAVSAPGKVLVCGGYLITDRPNIGLSLALSSRFHTVARRKPNGPGGPALGAEWAVDVVSPQFSRTFPMRVLVRPNGSGEGRPAVSLASDGGANPFIAAAVLFATAVAVARRTSGEGAAAAAAAVGAAALELRLYADNDFYSQANWLRREGLPLTTGGLRQVPRFNPIVGELGKTGLGSSACLVTSLVGGLLSAVGAADAGSPRAGSPRAGSPRAASPSGKRRRVDPVPSRDLVHAVAQFAHCHAQGKIGSGFDVCSAVYGSGVYRRFSPGRLTDAIRRFPRDAPLDALALAGWDHSMEPMQMPRGIKLLLGDVNKGSCTPGMVGSYKKWKDGAGAEGSAFLERMAGANEAVVGAVRALHAAARCDPAEYDAALGRAAELPASAWAAAGGGATGALADLASAFARQRALFREMGERSGVEMEPPQQTALLDATCRVPGVLSCGCPGAGGYDAVYALCVGDAARRRLCEAWEAFEAPKVGMQKGSVCALLVSEDGGGGLQATTYAAGSDALQCEYPGS